MVLVSEPTYPGIAIESKPIGLFRMYDEKGKDDKILCVPVHDPNWNYANNLDDIPQHMLREIENFFVIYKELEEKKTGVEGWEDVASAFEVIEKAEKRYRTR